MIQVIKESPIHESIGSFGFKYRYQTIYFKGGVNGILFQDKSNDRFYIDNGPHRIYYASREHAITALYYYKAEGRIIQEGKL
jgi:hypothetical protein